MGEEEYEKYKINDKLCIEEFRKRRKSETLWCCYLTVYMGNKLPPFYIGYTSLDKILKGYRGSVASKKYKHIWYKELKENPQLFEIHSLGTSFDKKEVMMLEEYYQRAFNVHRNPLYTNQNIGGYMFVTPETHDVTPETAAKISQALMGHEVSQETREKISKTLKGHLLSNSTKEAIKKFQTGRSKSPESIAKRTETRKQKRLLNPSYGTSKNKSVIKENQEGEKEYELNLN